MPLSIQRTDIIGALCNFLYWDVCITIVTAFTVVQIVSDKKVKMKFDDAKTSSVKIH